MTPRYRLPLLLSFWLCPSPTVTLAQIPHSLDSLQTYVQTHPPTDTNYVNALLKLADLTTRTQASYERADSLLRAAEKLALKLGFGRGVYYANTFLGSNYYVSDHPQQTLEYLQKASALAESYQLGPYMIANSMTNVGAAYTKLRQYQKAIDSYLRSLRIQEQYNLQPRIDRTYNGIGLALHSINRSKEAIPYFQQALVLRRQTKDPYGMAIGEQNLGKCYDNLNQEAKALAYYQTALKWATESGSALLQADILVNTGLAFLKLHQPRQAKLPIEQALAISTKQQHRSGMATHYFDLGLVYQELKEYKPAEQYIKKALALANEQKNEEKIALYTQGLADLYGGMKNFQQAYVYQLERNQKMDSTTTIRTNAEVQRMVAKYETQKKEARIKLLQQQAKLSQQAAERTRFATNTILLVGLLILLLGASVSAWLLNRARVRRLEEAQQLRQQIAHDLHDEVGSTLSSISLLSSHTDTLLSQNRAETAQKMVQKIYVDARQILESIDEIIWTINPGNDSLSGLVLRLQAYARPLMESKQINFSCQMDAALEQLPLSMEVRRHLYLLSKEALTNLVKYSQATQATLRLERRGAGLVVQIEDNGVGFDPHLPSTRTGQQSMAQRAQALGGRLVVESGPNQGTRVELTAGGSSLPWAGR